MALSFGVIDYVLFAMMLALSVVVGVYFGVCGRKNNIKRVDYLMGGKTMGAFPVGVSLAACHISGITLMGAPAEVYVHGVHFMLVCAAAVLMPLALNCVYLSVFYDLQLTSTYEYLQLRFNQHVRLMASFLFTIQLFLFLPIVIYVPSLAFQQVSGADLHLIAILVSAVCIFYTMLGGLKAVVWTDFLQAFVMVGALIAVMVLGVVRVGGFGRLWKVNAESGRLDVSFDPSPFVRNTFWSMVVGATFGELSGPGIHQGTVLKLLSLPSRAKTRRALVVFSSTLVLLKFLSAFAGLIMFAAFGTCDPLKTGKVGRPDQLLPHYMMGTAGHIPGLPGLFVAGVFSAALSSMSSTLNCLAGVVYEDFVAPCLRRKPPERQVNYIMMGVVGLFGALGVGCVFVVERLGAVLELVYSSDGITSGAICGLFTLGILFPSANSQGALAGGAVALLLMGWSVVGKQWAEASGALHDPWLPTTTDACPANTTLVPWARIHQPTPPDDASEPFALYRLSYMYLGLVGMLTVVVVGLAVSAVSDGLFNRRRPSRIRELRLYAPFVRRRLAASPRYTPSAPADDFATDLTDKERRTANRLNPL